MYAASFRPRPNNAATNAGMRVLVSNVKNSGPNGIPSDNVV
jgi:hypothetical protein